MTEISDDHKRPMHLLVRSGGCGSGKTYATLNEMVCRPGYYIIAIETVARFAEVLTDLNQYAAAHGATPEIISKASIQPGSTIGQSGNVRADIMALPEIWESDFTPHVICLVTHSAIKMIDTDAFGRWMLVIDEVPQTFQMETLNSEASAEWFRRTFELAPSSNGKWSRVSMREDAVTSSKLGRDDRMQDWLPFYRAVESGQADVYCDLVRPDQMAEDRVAWSWWAFWRVEQLRGFGKVLFLGNNFMNSVFAKTVMHISPGTTWQELPVGETRTFQRRTATVHCFASRHRITRSMYQREVGQDGLRVGQMRLQAVGDYIRENSDGNHIWSCNAAIREFLGDLPGEHLTPRQAGSNQYKKSTSCSMIYSAKPSPLLTSIFGERGISPDDICEERELETIVQMATRIAVRDPDSIEHLTYYVYDTVQAAHLASYLKKSGYVDVNLNVIDLGFAYLPNLVGSPGPKVRVLTPEEGLERKVRQNELARQRNVRSRARKAAIAPPQPRGRRRKVADKGDHA